MDNCDSKEETMIFWFLVFSENKFAAYNGVVLNTRSFSYCYWFSILQERDIPILIFSAGLADIIEEVILTEFPLQPYFYSYILLLTSKFHLSYALLSFSSHCTRSWGRSFTDLSKMWRLCRTGWYLMTMVICYLLKVLVTSPSHILNRRVSYSVPLPLKKWKFCYENVLFDDTSLQFPLFFIVFYLFSYRSFKLCLSH